MQAGRLRFEQYIGPRLGASQLLGVISPLIWDSYPTYITPLISSHEPPSRVSGVGFRAKGFSLASRGGSPAELAPNNRQADYAMPQNPTLTIKLYCPLNFLDQSLTSPAKGGLFQPGMDPVQRDFCKEARPSYAFGAGLGFSRVESLGFGAKITGFRVWGQP